jgi:hypothetical protein
MRYWGLFDIYECVGPGGHLPRLYSCECEGLVYNGFLGGGGGILLLCFSSIGLHIDLCLANCSKV